MGFQNAKSDFSLFIQHTSTSIRLVLVHVDDILITDSDSIAVQHLIASPWYLRLLYAYWYAFVSSKVSIPFNPTEVYLQALKRFLQYLKGTTLFGLQLSKSSIFVRFSDRASCLDDRKSTDSYCVFLDDNLVSWHFGNRK